ncbi:M16 family metallopeptidase, partial [Steroidobacter sp.]|uniref:M16 family metallopeptidase n=1 Tax=Steroidobacter sp. TaxID=1978227 RepID=UPI001A5176F1
MDTVRGQRWLLTLALPLGLLASSVSNAAAARQIELPQLDIPYTKHVLANGLTLLVHEDHKTAQVSVDINYRVGTGDEPPGVTGISHLFEHLMFRGSEHHDHDMFDALLPLGASAGTVNGMAYVDRTHYFETVASGALDAILWLESDRMGYLLGAIDQAKLDEQRGVVHNERRSIENTPWHKIGTNPYGRNAARLLQAIWPPGHPYSHLYIGTEEDLDSVTLDGVKQWFRKWYTPSNAVLVLSGDVTAAEAKSKVERYFGALPPGMSTTRVNRWSEPMPGNRRDVAYDSELATAALARVWSIPNAGLGAADADYLELLAAILSQPSSRLSQRLIVEQKLANEFAIDVRKNEIGSQVTLRLTAMPGIDLARVERLLEEELARMLKEGPSADELQAARMSKLAEMVSSIQSTSAKAHLLGKYELFLGNADAWKISFERLKNAKPGDLAAAGQRWLQKGNYTLVMLPRAQLAAASHDVDRKAGMPAVNFAEVQPPKFERTALSNGAQVLFAQRQDAPEVTVNLLIPIAASGAQQAFPVGIETLVMDLSLAGTDKLTGTQLSQALGKLGASLKVSADADSVQLSLKTLSTSFPEAMTLFAD